MMDFTRYDYFLIVDLEATCCERQTIKRHEMEIIEIGAVMVKREDLSSIDSFQTFIKPVRHPVLTEFCKQLTTIAQEQVDRAPSYADAIAAFNAWKSAYPNALFCSWGDYDRKQFEQDSRFHKLPYPFASEHLNLKVLFTDTQKLPKRYGMNGALELAGIPLEGTHHRGIDDARNMTRLLPYILGTRKLER